MKLLLLLFTLISLANANAANLCSSYFSNKNQDNLLDYISTQAKDNNNPHFWIQALRSLSEDQHAFPFAEQVRFGTYYKAEGAKLPQYKSHILFGLIWRGSHVDLPQVAPQSRAEVAEFLVHFAYAMEQQLANRNTFSFPLKASFSYLKARHTLEARRHNRLEKVKSMVDNSNTSRIVKPFLQLYLALSTAKSFLKIQLFEAELRSRFASMWPQHYVRDVNFILKAYDLNIQQLMRRLHILTGNEILLSERTRSERHWAHHFTNGVFQFFVRPFLPPLLPMTFWEPLKSRVPPAAYNAKQPSTWIQPSSMAATMKWFSDGSVIAMRTTAILLATSFFYQVTMETIIQRQMLAEFLKYENQPREIPVQIIERPSQEQAIANYLLHLENLKTEMDLQRSLLEKSSSETETQKIQEEIAELEHAIHRAETQLEALRLVPDVNAP